MFVVTGGGRGIGRALAHALAMRGESVLIVGRSEHALLETAARSTRIHYVCADLSEPSGCEQLIAHLQAVQTLRGLVHNAGIIDPIAPIADISAPEWRACMAINLDAPLFLTQQLYHKLTNGRVLHVGSGAAHFPVVGWAAYCVSKAALAMLTRCWQLECASIGFTSVMPGIVDTDMQALIRRAHPMAPEKRAFFRRLKEANQLVSEASVAAFLCWLLLDVDSDTYRSKEWDIYDTSHHHAWCIPPHTVPEIDATEGMD